MKVALIFEGDIYHQRGEFIAIHNRMKSFVQSDSIIVDAYVCGFYCDKLLRWLTKAPDVNRVDNIQIDGIKYNCIWYKRSWIDIISRKLFKRSTSFEFRTIRKLFHLEKYDLIYAHSRQMGRVAISYKMNMNIPCVVTWHGSDIHSLPFQDKNWYNQTKSVLYNADYNLFVSSELKDIANGICKNIGSVTLNGIDTQRFYPYSKEQKSKLRESLGITESDKVIAYVGNCLSVKNVEFLPFLFSNIYCTINNSHFYIIGSGDFKKLFTDYELPITFLGNVPNEEMPKYYNIFNLVVLPSKKEGLPITCLEAIACSTPFIGSCVGEIPNVIGEENTVPFDANFSETFVEKCINVLRSKSNTCWQLKNCYKSDYISSIELELFKKIIMKHK